MTRPIPPCAVIRQFPGRRWLRLIPRPAHRHRTAAPDLFARWIEHFGRELSELRPWDFPASSSTLWLWDPGSASRAENVPRWCGRAATLRRKPNAPVQAHSPTQQGCSRAGPKASLYSGPESLVPCHQTDESSGGGPGLPRQRAENLCKSHAGALSKNPCLNRLIWDCRSSRAVSNLATAQSARSRQ